VRHLAIALPAASTLPKSPAVFAAGFCWRRRHFWGAAWGSLAFAGRGKLDIEIDAQRVLGGLLNTSPTFQFGTAVTSIAAGSVGEPSASTSRYLNTSAIVARRGLMRIRRWSYDAAGFEKGVGRQGRLSPSGTEKDVAPQLQSCDYS
jgi:hypothetical protein